MSNLLTPVVSVLFAWTVMTLVLSWVLALIYRFLSSYIARMELTHAARWTLVYGLTAPLSAALALILLYLPDVAFFLVADHCHGADCAPHALQMRLETISGMTIFTMIVVTVVFVGSMAIVQSLSGRRRLQVLNDLSEAGAGVYRIVENPAALAWCAGLFRPQIYLSSGLVNALSTREVRIILAHELAHAVRKDNLRKWLLHWVTIAWPHSVKQRIRQDFADYTEQISDLAAARVSQGETDSSDLIRLLNRCSSNCTSRVGPQHQMRIQQRIRALERALDLRAVRNREGRRNVTVGHVVVSVWFVSVVMAVHFGHPLLEWLSR